MKMINPHAFKEPHQVAVANADYPIFGAFDLKKLENMLNYELLLSDSSCKSVIRFEEPDISLKVKTKSRYVPAGFAELHDADAVYRARVKECAPSEVFGGRGIGAGSFIIGSLSVRMAERAESGISMEKETLRIELVHRCHSLPVCRVDIKVRYFQETGGKKTSGFVLQRADYSPKLNGMLMNILNLPLVHYALWKKEEHLFDRLLTAYFLRDWAVEAYNA
jgi:hypothetical protein